MSLQSRAVDLVKGSPSSAVKTKVKSLSESMYKALGGAASVNPYSANFREDAVKDKRSSNKEQQEDKGNNGSEAPRRTSLRASTRVSTASIRRTITPTPTPDKASPKKANSSSSKAKQNSKRKSGEIFGT